MPSNSPITRVAMWSGPRNISTAMLRSWGARPDTIVCDEPLYAHYLHVTQDRRHPMYDEILASHEADLARVTEKLTGPLPPGKSVFYQKHMAQHLLPDVDRTWTDSLTNCLLIRDPAAVLASFVQLLPNPTPRDLGFPQQIELLERWLATHDDPPPIIESSDVLRDPPAMLASICDRVGVPYTKAMLSWAPGIPATDGVWSAHWYDKVAKTTGWGPYHETKPVVPDSVREVLKECQPLYDRLFEMRVRPTPDEVD